MSEEEIAREMMTVLRKAVGALEDELIRNASFLAAHASKESISDLIQATVRIRMSAVMSAIEKTATEEALKEAREKDERARQVEMDASGFRPVRGGAKGS